MLKLQGILVTVFLSTLFVAVGCGAKNSVEGKWNMTVPGSQLPPGSTVTVDFQKPDKMAMDVNMDVAGNKMKLTIVGTWSQSGDTITITGSDVKVDAGTSPMGKQIEQAMQGQKATMLSEINKSSSGTIKWESADKFTSGKEGQVATFTRIK
ncbi:MAG: hypothetical protein K1X67_01870 [Fimbriimonadaceae bacterium]|nr:hypothetical protein [Fimbriimonadaceae bacterium]